MYVKVGETGYLRAKKLHAVRTFPLNIQCTAPSVHSYPLFPAACPFAQVARADILPFFGQIFEGLVKLSADNELKVPTISLEGPYM